MPTDPVLTLDDLAQRAYDAYGAETDHKNFRGEPMPAWDDLPCKIQDAWRSAALEVKNTLTAWLAANAHRPASK